MNYIEEVAKLLGVELGEKFRIKDVGEDCVHDELYMFTTGGLATDAGVYVSPYYLNSLLTKERVIIKMPFKPLKGERYWYFDTSRYQATADYYYGTLYDLAFFKIGNCFRTKEEAETKGKIIIEQIRKEIEEK